MKKVKRNIQVIEYVDQRAEVEKDLIASVEYKEYKCDNHVLYRNSKRREDRIYIEDLNGMLNEKLSNEKTYMIRVGFSEYFRKVEEGLELPREEAQSVRFKGVIGLMSNEVVRYLKERGMEVEMEYLKSLLTRNLKGFKCYDSKAFERREKELALELATNTNTNKETSKKGSKGSKGSKAKKERKEESKS